MPAVSCRRLITALLFALAVVLPAARVGAQDAAKPLWSGRFDVEPNKALLAWGASFGFDKRLFEDDVTGSMAWAEALARVNVLTPAEAQAIQRGLDEPQVRVGQSGERYRCVRSSLQSGENRAGKDGVAQIKQGLCAHGQLL